MNNALTKLELKKTNEYFITRDRVLFSTRIELFGRLRAKKKKNKGSKHKKRCTKKYMQIPRTKTSRFRRPRNRVYHTHPGSAGFCQNAHDFGFVRAPVIHPHPNHRHRATPSAGSATTWWGFTIAGTGCDRSERYIIIFHTFRNYIPETFALVTPRRRGGVLLWRSRQ